MSWTKEPSPSCHMLPNKNYVICINYNSTVHITDSESSRILLEIFFIVSISVIVSYTIPKYTITNSVYLGWISTILRFGSLCKQHFDDTLVLFKQQDRNVSKAEKKSYYYKHVKDHTFMKSTKKWKKVWVLKFVKCLQNFLVFKQKIYCLLLQMEGVGGHTIGYISSLNILKLQPIQLLEAVVSY